MAISPQLDSRLSAIAFREDGLRVRKGFADENLAIGRHIALNKFKMRPLVRDEKRKNVGWNEEYLLKVLAARFFMRLP